MTTKLAILGLHPLGARPLAYFTAATAPPAPAGPPRLGSKTTGSRVGPVPAFGRGREITGTRPTGG